MFGHAAAVIAAMGRCAGDPVCPAPASIADDYDPAIRRCPQHALAHLRRLDHAGAPA